LQGVGIELTSGLLPGLTNTIQKTAEFIAEFDDWENVIKTAGYVLAGLTGGVT
jgi:hypothetical protein